LKEIPKDRSAWVIGFDNKFATNFNVTEDYGVALGENSVTKIKELQESGSLVYAIPNPANNSYSLGFVGTVVKEAIPGLTRLLPHYGKYSYLGFEGDRPNNVLKGTFPALHSPLHKNILYDNEIIATNGHLEPELPLINQ